MSAASARRLAAHLAVCVSCRAYKGRLELIQEQAGGGEEVRPSAEFLEDFSGRLRARLALLEAGERPRRAAFRAPRWAWLAAPAAAALLVFLLIGRLRSPAGFDLAPAEGYLGSVNQVVIDNPDLAIDLNAIVAASIQDEIGGISPEEIPAVVDDPSFWDNLSEDEAVAIDGEIRKEIKS